MTVVGTRPEIIRMARILSAFDDSFDHMLAHTGQNFDRQLSDVFFEEMAVRPPDVQMDCDTSSVGAFMADTIARTEQLIAKWSPEAFVVLGDTNSSVSLLSARRSGVPTYHLEAGNRSFDQNVPEEINRRLADHLADYNLVYSEHSRRNLLNEGLRADRIHLMGSPLREVFHYYRDQIGDSEVLERLKLKKRGYILASLHRAENVDHFERLHEAIASLDAVATRFGVPVLLSLHPRTRGQLTHRGIELPATVRPHEPLGFLDYNSLQSNSLCVISDSGTVSEESLILGFAAVTIRDAIERPEALDVGGILVSGIDRAAVLDSAELAIKQFQEHGVVNPPNEYTVSDSSRRVVNFIRSTAVTHHSRNAIRRA